MSESTTPRKLARLGRFLALTLGSLLLVGLAGLLLFRGYYMGHAEDDRNAMVAKLDASDPDWRWDKLLATRRQVPAADNGALVVLKAVRLLPEPFLAEYEAVDGQIVQIDVELQQLPPDQRLPEPLATVMRSGLAEVQPALEVARMLVARPDGCYPLEWTEIVFDTELTCQQARAVSRLLCLSAIVLAEDDKMEQAGASILAASNGATSVGDEPLYISQLVRMALLSRAVFALERVLARGDCSDQMLESLQERIEQELAQRNRLMTMATRGERAIQFRVWNGIIAGKVPLEALESGDQAWWRKMTSRLYLPPLATRAQQIALEVTTQLVDISEQPVDAQEPLLEEMVQELKERRHSFSIAHRMAFSQIPAVTKVLLADHRTRMDLQTARCALAAERYRRAHGKWPEKLADLVPQFLDEVPRDLFADRPLTLRKVDAGIVIYSFGMDGNDDQGEINRRTQTSDQGFRLIDRER